MKSWRERLKHWLIALDQFLLCTVTLGDTDPDWTLSAYAWSWELEGRWYGKPIRVVIDCLFFFDDNHCQESYHNEITR